MVIKRVHWFQSLDQRGQPALADGLEGDRFDGCMIGKGKGHQGIDA